MHINIKEHFSMCNTPPPIETQYPRACLLLRLDQDFRDHLCPLTTWLRMSNREQQFLPGGGARMWRETLWSAGAQERLREGWIRNRENLLENSPPIPSQAEDNRELWGWWHTDNNHGNNIQIQPDYTDLTFCANGFLEAVCLFPGTDLIYFSQ